MFKKAAHIAQLPVGIGRRWKKVLVGSLRAARSKKKNFPTKSRMVGTQGGVCRVSNGDSIFTCQRHHVTTPQNRDTLHETPYVNLETFIELHFIKHW